MATATTRNACSARSWAGTALVLAACTSATPKPILPDTDVVPPDGSGVDNPFDGVHTDVDTDTGTGTADDTAADTDEPAPPAGTVDCAALPDGSNGWGFRSVPGARAYHGIAFDAFGNMYGNAQGVVFQADYSGASSVAATGVGTLEQMEMLPDGDIVASRPGQGNILRIGTNGSVSTIASVNSVYGVRVGPDGMVYTANENRMHRIDPDTGEVEIFINNFGGFAPKVFDWNLDFTQMYIGTNYSGGKLWVVDLDANFDPVGQPTVFVDSVGESWHDAVAVDICGNIYVAEFWSGGIYRVPPDGSRVDRLIATGNGSQQYGHGIVWGSGIGGWPDTKIYLPQPYNGNVVIEMDIGVPYRTFTGSVINRP